VAADDDCATLYADGVYLFAYEPPPDAACAGAPAMPPRSAQPCDIFTYAALRFDAPSFTHAMRASHGDIDSRDAAALPAERHEHCRSRGCRQPRVDFMLIFASAPAPWRHGCMPAPRFSPDKKKRGGLYWHADDASSFMRLLFVADFVFASLRLSMPPCHCARATAFAAFASSI